MSERARLAYVDGLRAVAVLAVVADHAGGYSSLSASTALGRVLANGARGVELFFVLSGFCLAYPALAKLKRDGAARLDVPTYAARRLVRILPPYWCAIAAIVILGGTLMHLRLPLPPGIRAGALSAPEIGRQSIFLYADNRPILTDSFWSLPVEFYWYFIFPILLLAWMRSVKLFAILLVVLSLLAFVQHIPASPLPYLPAFGLGIVAAAMRVWNKRLGIIGLVALIAFVYLAAGTSYNGQWAQQPYNPPWQIAAFFFVVCAGEFAIAERLFSIRFLTFIGVASYSIYLVHLPALSAAEQLGANPAVAAVIGVAVGIAFWFLAERPFNETALRDKLVHLISSPFVTAIASKAPESPYNAVSQTALAPITITPVTLRYARKVTFRRRSPQERGAGQR